MLSQELSVELRDHHELFRPLGYFQKDLSVSRKQPDELLSFSFPPGINQCSNTALCGELVFRVTAILPFAVDKWSR